MGVTLCIITVVYARHKGDVMCFSAAVRAEFKAFQNLFPKSRLSIKDFFELYLRRKSKPKPVLRTPKAMDAQFAKSHAQDLAEIRALIEEFDAAQKVETEQDLFKQRQRLADAQRSLQSKPTKKATDDERIATAKIEQALAKLKRLQREDLSAGDSRIFPGWWAPVLMFENGEPIVRPMRYQCRPAGKPLNYDTRFPGTYNARRDNLRGFWKQQFGATHGLMIVTRFYENVSRDGSNVVLEFQPEPAQDMLVACLYSHWMPPAGSDEDDLWSFAAITDEPPPEVAAAGHDRCIVQLRPENVQAWLTPQGRSLEELDALLDDKAPAYYAHKLAA